MIAGCGFVQDGFDHGAIAETGGGAGRVGEQLANQIAGNLALVFKQQGFEVADVVKGAPIFGCAARLHWLAVIKSEGLVVFSRPGSGVLPSATAR